MYVRLDSLKTKLRGGVRAGAEGHPGFEYDRMAIRVCHRHPRRDDEQTFADRDRLIVIPPGLFPVPIFNETIFGFGQGAYLA